MDQVAPGIHRWTSPHPEWRTSREEVVSWALVHGDAVALVDPQLPPRDEPRRAALEHELDELVDAARRLEIMVTIPYHTRSAEPLFERYWGRVATRLWGHAAVRKRFFYDTPLSELPRLPAGSGADVADGLAVAFAIGRPRRYETPLYFPGPRTVVFGDAVVGTAQGLRLWSQNSRRLGWWRDVFAPTVAPLLGRPLEHVLVTHGPSAIGDGAAKLAEALAAPPVDDYL